jgi:hypothetical protein
MEEKLSTEKRMKLNKPIEVWQTPDGSWRWEVYKKYQKPDKESQNPFARWFCKVFSPITREQMSSGSELGDVYIKDIKSVAKKLDEVV